MSAGTPDRSLAPHDCELPWCPRRAARGRRFCSVAHLQAAQFQAGDRA